MGLFNFKKETVQPVPIKGLICCEAGERILQQHAHELLAVIRNQISAPAAIYQSFYFQALSNLAAFCQNMPLTEQQPPYSLLQHQLTLCQTVLKLRQGLLLPKNANAEAIAQQEPQWTYAFFMAALVFQLAQVQADRKILLYNRAGELIGSWHPLLSHAFENASYFSLQWQPSFLITNSSIITAIVLQIIPKPALVWLSQNPVLFVTMWQAITENPADNLLHKIIQQASQPTAVEKNKQAREENPLNHLLKFLTIQSHHPEKIYWLRVKDGLLIANQALNDYFTGYESIKTAAEFFKTFKPYLLNRQDNYYFSYRPHAFQDRRLVEGVIILKDYLPKDWKQIPLSPDFQPAIQL